MKLFYLFLFLTNFATSFRHHGAFFSRQIHRLHSIPMGNNFRGNLGPSPRRQYPLSRFYYEKYLERMAQQNNTQSTDEGEDMIQRILKKENITETNHPELRIIINPSMMQSMMNSGSNNDDGDDDENNYRDIFGQFRAGRRSNRKKSENFEIIQESGLTFDDVGGYQNIKDELHQCIDIISNFSKYAQYNVRVPKGLIFEGPPGNGKTLLAKALAGEANTSYIPVSGSQFQEKYVGVGSSRIRELFELACDNRPCIVFIDEIDALGRKRSSDGETSGTERDSTLNELLVALDGFKNISGVFLIGATNRADLLDDALVRPGRIDKRIYINNPDKETREHILKIHLAGKPHEDDINIENLVENTMGFSGAQIENLLNEAMLNALRENREVFSAKDLDVVLNKIMAGWQPTDHHFTDAMIKQIAIHEMGHAVVGMLCKHHGKMTKVVINLSAPNTPAYTVFEPSGSNIVTREALFEHLMILLGGRIAEEVFYGVSVTTGAINDFEEALKLAQKMVCYYGMGKQVIYPSNSEKYKEMIDSEVATLINDAYGYAEFILRNAKELMKEGSEILEREQLLKAEIIQHLINTKYENVKFLKL